MKSSMVIGVLKEKIPETRVAVVPDSIRYLKDHDLEVLIEKDAGTLSNFSDEEYKKAGAILKSRSDILSGSDIFPVVNHPGLEDMTLVGPGKVIAGCLNPFSEHDMVRLLVKNRVTSFSMELLPRTTIAQSMDVLSSMAMISGYKAVIEAAMLLPGFMPMFMTAAGTLRPARVLILGAGVAGLQAIATARRLGAVVEVFDVRSAVREEVLSLGGKFIEVPGSKEDISAGGYAVQQTGDFLKKQAELIRKHAVKSDVIICTAQIQGKKAPVLITKEIVGELRPGSIIIDIAASTGGNCELTRNSEKIVYNGVTILGQSDYPALMPYDASKMYSNNLISFLKLIIGSGERVVLNWDDEIVSKTCLTHDGRIINTKIKQLIDGDS